MHVKLTLDGCKMQEPQHRKGLRVEASVLPTLFQLHADVHGRLPDTAYPTIGVPAAGANTSMRAPLETGPSRSSGSLPAAQPSPAKVRKHRPLNEVEEILQNARKGNQKADGNASQRHPTQAQPPMIDVRAERRAFMSHKASQCMMVALSSALLFL